MKEKKPTLVLLDAHAIIHRAYHALPQFTNSAGEPTGALYGVVSMILKIIEDFQPDYVVACYDLPGKTFRHEAYTAYKGTRGEAEQDLIMQLQSSRTIMEAFAIPMYDAPGFEADDMLGTITEQLKDTDIRIVIASGDMDTLQLVRGDRVQVFTLRKGIKDTVVYNEDAVRDRFGFAPELLIDYKGLRGDTSDNIPGIKGIGEKTATTLIQKFGSLEDLYALLETEDGYAQLREAGISDRIIRLITEEREAAFFSKTLATIRTDAPITFTLPEHIWQTELDPDAVREICHRYEFRSLWKRVEDMFAGQSAAPLAPAEDIDLREIQETGIALWLLNSEITHPTKDDILQYAQIHSFADARAYIFKELEQKNLFAVYQEIEAPLIPVIERMEGRGLLLDVPYFKALSQKYHTELDNFERKIFDMAGMTFNIKSPKQLGEVLFDHMGISTKGLKKTAGGSRSTKESELEKLKDVHPIVAEILSYRQFQKMLSTYIDNLPDMVDEQGRLHTHLVQTGTTTGRFSSQKPNLQNIPADQEFGTAIRKGFVATPGYKIVAIDYSQIELRVTAMLSQEPEFIRVFEEGQDIHAAVAARVFNVDQQEVTPDMRRKAKVINFGIIYGMGITALQKNLDSTRKEAQAFYDAYFASFPGLRAYLDSIKDFAYAHGYTETLFGRRRYFPALQSPIPYVRASAERMAINAPIQGTATADIIKLALKDVVAMIDAEGYADQVFPLLQVHDELLFEIHESVIDVVIPRITELMETVLERSFLKYETRVPLKVSVGMGDNWADAK